MERPTIAIIDYNTLAMLGLKQMLEQVIPIVTVELFSSMEQLMKSDIDSFIHYFVSVNILLEHRPFFMEHRRKTIVLTMAQDPSAQLSDFHCLCINVPEERLVKSLLMLEQHAHAGGKHLPPMPRVLQAHILSDREIEVLSLIAQGYMNKEVADRLNISLTTVISHRKNIIEKLGMKTVSALTIYAVMHGYVDINKI